MLPAERAIHPYRDNALGWLYRCVEAGCVMDGGGIKQHQVGPVAGADQAAFVQRKAAGRQAGHLVNGGFQAEQLAFAAVVAQYARKGTP